MALGYYWIKASDKSIESEIENIRSRITEKYHKVVNKPSAKLLIETYESLNHNKEAVGRYFNVKGITIAKWLKQVNEGTYT